MTPPDDDILSQVHAATTGDRGAIEALLERYLPALEAYVARHAGPVVRAREAPADVAQSVCREALEHLHAGRLHFQGEPQFRQWLYRAAMMKLASRRRHWRAQRRDAGREQIAGAAESSAPGPEAVDPATPSQAARLSEEVERFADAFDQLDEGQQQAIVLHHLEGLSHEEIAERLEITAANSRVRLSRALARLARLGVGS